MSSPERKLPLVRLLLASVAGAVIALCLVALISWARAASGGYRAEDYIEWPGWALGAIPGGGALAGCVAALLVGRKPLPRGVHGAALGALAGVSLVVVVSLASGYQTTGLIYGVPAGLLLGGLAGYLRWNRTSA